MIFYDFECFIRDWLVVCIDTDSESETVIVNDPALMTQYYDAHKNDIWCGFNSRHYDKFILQGILAGFNPKKINDWIIVKGNNGNQFSSTLKKFPLLNYDVMSNVDRGLKFFEASMGNDIRETSVDFNITRKLTPEEIAETIKYCRHDVEQTMEVFARKYDDFTAQMALMKMFERPIMDINKTKVQLSAAILGASARRYTDEFDIDFPPCLELKKYDYVREWYANPLNRNYKAALEYNVAGVPHVFAWGGVHGARAKYNGAGYYIMCDVGSLYPSLMLVYGLMSRSVPPEGVERFRHIYDTRLALKHAGKKKEQAPYKIVLNGTYGAMKDKFNPLYDPRQANRVCVYGQLLLLMLIEWVEPFAILIQSNTDGLLLKMPDGWEPDAWFEKIDDICYRWEKTTGLNLEFDEYVKVYEKDVNNYLIQSPDGKVKAKGAYLKELSALDYDLPIVNHALRAYMIDGVPVEKTINGCNDLKEFQLMARVSSKYKGAVKNATFRKEKVKDGKFDGYYDKDKLNNLTWVPPRNAYKTVIVWNGDGEMLNERTFRIFASLDAKDGGIHKISGRTGKPEKIANSPEHCFIYNDSVNGVPVPAQLDKQWYIDLANKRLNDFGVN